MNKEQRKEFQELQKKLQEENEGRFLSCYVDNMFLVVDRETGVEYFKPMGLGEASLSIVLDADGKPKVNKSYIEGHLNSDVF